MHRLLIIISALAIGGCGSTRIAFEPTLMEFADALLTAEELTLAQHPTFKPDFFEIGSQYVAWGYGTVANSAGTAAVIGNLIIGGSTTRSRNVGDRLYFRSIGEVQLLSWKRKMKQWYLVSITDPAGRQRHHVYRTRYLDRAETYVNAMETILSNYRVNPEIGLVSPWPDKGNRVETNNPNTVPNEAARPKDMFEELVKLDELRKRGILTDAEFDAAKKKLLESN